MPSADLVDGRIVIEGTAFRDRDTIRELPGVKFRDDAWSCPASWPAVKILRSLFGDRLTIGPELHDWIWNEYHGRVRPVQEYRVMAMDMGADLTGNPALYPYQRTGVRFLQNANGAILADDMGTGKTVQAIDTLVSKHAFPALVVCPKTAKAGWVREFTKWAPQLTVVSVGGSAVKRRQALEQPADVYVTHWQSLALHSRLAPYGSVRLSPAEKMPKELNRPWGAVIADEAHRAINPKAKQTRALWAIGASAEFRIAMTGTPIADTPDDLWSLLHFVAPHEWPSKTKYIDRYCQTSWGHFGGLDILGLKPQTADEFHSLVDLRLLRRPKALALPWLPEKTYERREAEMSPKQAAAYKQFKKEMIADLDGGLGVALNPLTLLTRLTQLASATLTVQPDGSMLMSAPSSKVEALVELLEDMGGAPLAVFAESRQLIDLASERLTKEGISHSLIVGGQTELVRSMAEEDFMAGRVRVLLLTYGAGSESLTLTKADTICRMERSWSMIKNTQAINRIDRPGQESDKCLIVDLIAPGTIEDGQLTALEGKGERMEEIVRDQVALRWLLKDI